jgi:hypothetical protein
MMKWQKSKNAGAHRKNIVETSPDGRWAKSDPSDVGPGKLIPPLKEYGICE